MKTKKEAKNPPRKSSRPQQVKERDAALLLEEHSRRHGAEQRRELLKAYADAIRPKN